MLLNQDSKHIMWSRGTEMMYLSFHLKHRHLTLVLVAIIDSFVPLSAQRQPRYTFLQGLS